MLREKTLRRVLTEIQARNLRVEEDKAWETSWTRKIVIFVLTYLAISVYFYSAGLSEPFKNALVPALAFVISTLSLPFFKGIWMKNRHKKYQ